MKLSKEQLKALIKEEAKKFISAGDAIELEINQNDGLENKEGAALVASKENGSFKKKTGDLDKEDAVNVEMGEMDAETGEIGAAVEITAASGTHKGDAIEGMHKADVEIKTEQPSVDASTPFEEKVGEVEMNSQDEVSEDGAKTYVEPGTEMKDAEKTGQVKAKFSEKPKNEKETAEVIAKGIQLPESFKSKKELNTFIMNEAKKLSNLI